MNHSVTAKTLLSSLLVFSTLMLASCSHSQPGSAAAQPEAAVQASAAKQPAPSKPLGATSTRVLQKRNGDSVLKAAFLGSSGLALVGALDGGASVWDVSTGMWKSHFTGPAFTFTDLAISPDNQTAFTPGPGAAARIWNVTSGQDVHTYQGSSDTIAVALSADGKLAAFGNNTEVQVWDIAANKRLYSYPLKSPINKLAFAGSMLVSVDRTGNLCKWKLATSSSPDCKTVFQNPNTGIAFSADGHLALIVTDDEQGNAILWDVDRAAPRQTFHVDPFVTAPAISADAKWLVYGTPDHAIKVWNLQTGRKTAELKSFGSDVLGAAAISTEGTKILLGNGDGTVVLWNLN